jgi:hypothetical protein
MDFLGIFCVQYCCHLSEASPRYCASPGGMATYLKLTELALGWGCARFEPGTAALQSGVPPLSHHTPLGATSPPSGPPNEVKYLFLYKSHIKGTISQIVTGCRWNGCLDLFLERCRWSFIIFLVAPSIFNSD